MKTIIAGSRGFDNIDFIFWTLDFLPWEVTEVVCGEARGPDTLGKEWALEQGIPVVSFVPDWDTHGKKAGMLRNIEMGDYADALVAFWDGKSRGTKQMIDYAKRKGLVVKEVLTCYRD